MTNYHDHGAAITGNLYAGQIKLRDFILEQRLDKLSKGVFFSLR